MSLTAAPLPRGIRGFVEARSGEAILGWAWAPARPDERLTVALRLDGQKVAEAVAALPREDLARGGIGDGAHAFRFDLAPEQAEQAAAFEVVVAEAEGREHCLEAAPKAPAAPVEVLAFARLQRGIEQLAAGQRALLRQAPSAEAGAVDMLARIAETQHHTAEQLESLELFVNRLDTRLAALAAEPASPRIPARSVALAALLGAGAAFAMALGLRHLM
jgi:hypothetical protein